MRPLIRVNTYSAAERFQILELCLLHLIKEKHLSRHELPDALNEKVIAAGCKDLPFWGRHVSPNSIPYSQLLSQLEDTGFVGVNGKPVVTDKGIRYMRKCPKNVRVAAARISCDVLDAIATVIS